jgi:Aspartyl protease
MVLALAAASLAGCGASMPAGGTASPAAPTPAGRNTSGIVRFSTPPASQGCAGAQRAAGGVTTIPVTVSRRQGQVAAMANVCINGKGPFPFLIDTGADGSIVTASLASKVGLGAIGQPLEIGGADCTALAHSSRITKWNVAGLALQPQAITYLNVPLFGQKGEPDGVIGSDVWSRFGAMRLDFRRGLITVPGPEHAAPSGETVIGGPTAQPVPGSLLHGRPAVTVPMRVDRQPAATGIMIQVRLGTHAPADFTPDTGASQSAVDSGVARQFGLRSLRSHIRQSTVCTITSLPEVSSGAWSVAGHRLRSQALGSTGLVATTGVAGLLGADQMSQFGSVIFDYSGGRLILGAG